jgi:hypothetical protein
LIITALTSRLTVMPATLGARRFDTARIVLEPSLV